MSSPNADTPMVSAVIVTWNVAEYLPGCVRSLAKSAGPMHIEPILVDNGSQDATLDVIESQFPEVTLIKNGENRGLTVANNEDVKKLVEPVISDSRSFPDLRP